MSLVTILSLLLCTLCTYSINARIDCTILNKYYFLEYNLRKVKFCLTLLFLQITVKCVIGPAINDTQAMIYINHVRYFQVLLVEADDLIKHS